MKGILPLAIILCFFVMTMISIFGGQGFPHLDALRQSLDRQKARNSDRQEYIDNVKREVFALEKDDRALEKAAREHLGMARPNEKIYFFEDNTNASGH